MERLAGLESHPLRDQYPCRLPVWWARRGGVEKDPKLRGVSGRAIVLRIPKQFRRVERLLARILRAPKELRRPLDTMNSLLWELCDGSRTFGEICQTLDLVFQEQISPVIFRTSAAIHQFQQQQLMITLEEPLNQRWSVGPGQTPVHQQLAEIQSEYGFDTEPIEGEAP